MDYKGKENENNPVTFSTQNCDSQLQIGKMHKNKGVKLTEI